MIMIVAYFICYLFAFAPLGRFFGGVALVPGALALFLFLGVSQSLRALPQAIAISPLGFS